MKYIILPPMFTLFRYLIIREQLNKSFKLYKSIKEPKFKKKPKKFIFQLLISMSHNNQQQITVSQVIESYKQLQNQDPQKQHLANQLLCSLPHRDQAWQISKNMIINIQDLGFQYLGSQILYQKVSMQLQSLSIDAKNQLKQFVFSKLQDHTNNYKPTIDKLASIAALIAATLILQGWSNFLQDLIFFMKKSQHHLKSGLFVLERFPQELKNTNRIAQGLKKNIIDQLLKYQLQLSEVFLSILTLNNEQLTQRCLQAMESWAKSGYNFLKYTLLIKKVLIVSLQSQNKFQPAILMMIQIIRSASLNRLTYLNQWQPTNQVTKYTPSQISSIKQIINYILQNKQNFIQKSIQPKYLDMYQDIIKQSLLSFGFLIQQKIGFQMLDVIMYFTKNIDLRISQSTFEFWIDFSQKISKCKIKQQIKNYFANYIQQLFLVIGKKTIVSQQSMLDDPDLKQDVTPDDLNAMSFAQYRRQSVTIYQYIYNFFLAFTKSPKYYFDLCFKYIGEEAHTQLGKGTQLALFCVKAPIQSMITDEDIDYICKFTDFIIKKGPNIYPLIVVQALLMIRDCTRQLKRNNTLCLNALDYSLYFLNDQKICFYAAQTFKTLMQTLTTINDHQLVSKLLHYYSTQQFSSQTIIDKIIQGIFSAITKMNNNQAISQSIKNLIQIILNRFQNIHKNINSIIDKPYLIPILEMKTILSNFQFYGQAFQIKYAQLYISALRNGLQMISIVIPYCLTQKINYIKFNQLGLSCSIYRMALRLCTNNISDQFLEVLNQTLTILTKQRITDMYQLLQLLCYTLTTFIKKFYDKLTNWIINKLPFINNFFLTYIQPLNLADPQIIKIFYQIQQSLILYDAQIFLNYGNPYQIFQIGLYILRHLNQPKMQRKVVNFIYLCCQMQENFCDRYQKVVQIIIGSIPIIAQLSHHNLSKIFLTTAPKLPNIHQLLTTYLKSNPYQGLTTQTITLLVNLIMFTLQANPNMEMNTRERNFMMIIKDLHELAKNGEMPSKMTQLEFRYALWKKNQFNHQ